MPLPKFPRRAQLAVAAATLVALGAAGGAGAVSLTRPSVQMAPTIQTPIAKLASTSGIVTVRGKVAELYGDRLVLQDASGRAMVDTGRGVHGTIRQGSSLLVQGHYDDGQMRASYLVDPAGTITPVGPPPPPRGPADRGPGGPGPRGDLPPRGPGQPGGPDGLVPPPPPGARNDGAVPPPPPPPAGCARIEGAPIGNTPTPPPGVGQPTPPVR